MTFSMRMILAIILIALITITASWSAEVLKVRGRQTLINVEGLDVQKGDTVDILDESETKVGTVKLLKIKKNRAIGIIKSQKKTIVKGMSASIEINDELSLDMEEESLEQEDKPKKSSRPSRRKSRASSLIEPSLRYVVSGKAEQDFKVNGTTNIKIEGEYKTPEIAIMAGYKWHGILFGSELFYQFKYDLDQKYTNQGVEHTYEEEGKT